MNSSMSSIFYPPSMQQISSICYNCSPVLIHHFSRVLTNQISQQFIMSMNNSHIFIYDNNNASIPKACTPFQFDLKFEILREQWCDQLTPGKPIGIKFEKDKCQSVTFYNSCPSAVDIWRIKLEEKLNQRGFHKLFKAKRKIGKGAFATVYLAQRLIDKKLVAVKAFSKQKQYLGDKGKDSLINEIQLMRKLRNHQSINNLQGVFQTQNSIYVILENLSGGQLHQKIKSGVKFSLNDTTKIMISILKGLAFMDSLRIIHRDLKPQNLIFRNKNSLEIVIADFGLATWAQQVNYLFVRCGTPGFVAPQIINIKDMTTHSDPISDVFSVGLIFHYLLLGRSVFRGSKYAQILSQNRSCDFKLVGNEYDQLDRNAFDLLQKMLEVNPRLRIRAYQALNHRFFKQCMDIQSQKTDIKYMDCPTFSKQTKITSIYQSPHISIKQKQNLSSLNTTPIKKTSDFKRKRESITINHNILTSRITNESS